MMGFLAVILGRSRATARSGNKRIPSIIVWRFSKYRLLFRTFIFYMKSFDKHLEGRDMGTSKMAVYLDGSKF
jgi:hypothetical protein